MTQQNTVLTAPAKLQTLKEIATEVNSLHGVIVERFVAASKFTLQNSIEVGHRLIKIRELLAVTKEMSFRDFISENLKFTRSSAYEYIQLAENEAMLTKAVADLELHKESLGLKAAIRLLAGVDAKNGKIESNEDEYNPFLDTTKTLEVEGIKFKFDELYRKYNQLLAAADTAAQQYKTDANVIFMAATAVDKQQILDETVAEKLAKIMI